MPIAKRIKIVRIPHGTAPCWVRSDWVGCEFPCEPECGHIHMHVSDVNEPKREGLIPAKEYLANPEKYAPKQIAGFSVDQAVALETLSKMPGRERAVEWWRTHGYPARGMAFRFKNEECEMTETLPA